jgi:hypothetical protein
MYVRVFKGVYLTQGEIVLLLFENEFLCWSYFYEMPDSGE